MSMKDFNNILPIKFLIVNGKLHNALFKKLNKHVKDMGYNTTEFLVMYAIAANGALTIQDIGARIMMTSGNMTYTIDKLEQRKLVKRVRCDEDRRKIFIDFTDEGKGEWEQVMIDHAKFMNKTFQGVDDQTIAETIENMKTIGKSFE